ncbi:hypothetical protein NDGK_02525 [Clostridiales bacterium CHKCI001]|nr:hypothetical protein NDGK_02525 [Clostridiales bacterium CHKCI001]
MDENSKLSILKKDLQKITDADDDYLKFLLQCGRKAMEREGIKINEDLECDMIQIHYAAYLFRKRASPDTTMPRFLRYDLNNLLFSQKGKINDI